jgi:peroxiredoxin
MKEGFKAKLPKETQEIMHRAAEELKNSGIMERAVKVGDKAPDFTLKNTAGRDVNLYHLLEQAPVVLIFYRGKW